MAIHPDDKIPAIVAGIFVLTSILIYQPKQYTNTYNNGLREPVNHIIYTSNKEGNSSVNGRKLEISQDISMVFKAEDEYWEIEYYNGNYYRTRREDWEELNTEEYLDIEELIGDYKDLKRYTQ